jgi:putative two-component system response regulator
MPQAAKKPEAATIRTILLVEDEAAYRKAVKRVLQNCMDGLRFLEASNGEEALAALATNPLDLVLLDLGMPQADGYFFLRRFRHDARHRAVPVCVMTAWSDAANRRKAIDLGADDFIGKPVDNTELETRVKSLLRIGQYQNQLNELNTELESKVLERTQSLQTALEELEEAQEESILAQRETVERLALAAEHKDQNTAAHLHRISEYSVLLARKCGWTDDDIDLLANASKMHDIGKIGIPDAILNKKGKLTEEEFRNMQRHPLIGATILSGSRSKLLQMGEQVAYTHHERFDGSGYPNKLAGKDIPEAGRIIAIADVFDALMTRRPYKEPWPFERVVTFMRDGRGTHFDPELLDLFIQDSATLIEISKCYPDTGKD